MTATLLQGDALQVLRTLPAASVHCVVTSPPYWTMRDYEMEGQLGLEPTLSAHLDRLSEVLGEVRRVLRKDGTLWLNYGDSYNTCAGGPGPNAGRPWARRRKAQPKLTTRFSWKSKEVKGKSLLGIPWRLAIRLEADGWWLRAEVIWKKPNPLERGNLDRPWRDHEHLFLLAKSRRYFFRGPADSVWTIPPQGYEGHPVAFPILLAGRCIMLGCPEGGTVLDPFMGSGAAGVAALRLGRSFIGIDLKPEYVELARRRIREDAPLLNQVEVGA